MAISSDTVIEFFGTQDLVTSTAAVTLGSSAFASTGAVANWTNDDDAPEVGFVFKGTFLVAPAAGGIVPLYARHIAVGAGSTDMTIPSTTFKNHLIAVFLADLSTAVQVLTARGFLPNLEASQVYQFLPENQASQTLSSDYTIHVTPITKGPHP